MARQDMPAFDVVERQPRLSDKVAQLMLDGILAGRFAIGDRLPSERELGEQFAVSRTVIREAVRALVAKGVIEVRSGSGLRVAAVPASAVQESMALFLRGGDVGYEKVHEVRRMLEIHIAGVAAERATSEDIQLLKISSEEMAEVIDDTESAAFCDLEFHRCIARATHNEVYLLLMDTIGKALIDVRRENLGRGKSARATLREHRKILESVTAHDVVGAREAMRLHLESVEKTWLALAGQDGRRL